MIIILNKDNKLAFSGNFTFEKSDTQKLTHLSSATIESLLQLFVQSNLKNTNILTQLLKDSLSLQIIAYQCLSEAIPKLTISGFGREHTIENELIRYEGFFKKGKYHGQYSKFYWESGNIEYVGGMYNSQQSGIGKEYHENGQLCFYGNFYKGKPHGKHCKLFTDTGVLFYEGSLNKGIKEGYGSQYHHNGKLQYIG